MIHAAHASRYHRGQVPDATPAHLARGEWQISRVYAVLGRPEPAPQALAASPLLVGRTANGNR